MLFTPFTRTWWKSLVKGEGSADTEGDLGEEELDLDSADHVEEEDEPRAHSRSHRSSRDDHDNDSDQDHDQDDEGDHFTHEGMTQGDGSGDLSNDDPLAPAFDLDRGAPIAPPSHQQIPAMEPHVNVKSAKEFFNSEILYRFDILEDTDRNELQGRYRVELKGYQGGIWTVLIGNQLEVVNRREDAEIVINMHQKDFLQLVNGELNPQLAIFAQKMKVQGDLRRCISFDRLLTPYID